MKEDKLDPTERKSGLARILCGLHACRNMDRVSLLDADLWSLKAQIGSTR